MNKEIITKLNNEFGPINWVQIQNNNNIPSGDWLRFNATPLTDSKEMEDIVLDIFNNGYTYAKNNKISKCENDLTNKMPLDEKVKKAIKKINTETYEVIIYLNKSIIPLVFITNPEISFSTYPNHPHINVDLLFNNKYFLPNSICYTYVEDLRDVYSLGANEHDIVLETLCTVVLWLFRHQIWEKTYQMFEDGIWIGKNFPCFDDKSIYLKTLNPDGKCRCGSKNMYYKCCMPNDFSIIKTHQFLSFEKYLSVTRREYRELYGKKKNFIYNIRNIFKEM